MADKKATRESYGKALADLGEKYDFLVCLRKSFPSASSIAESQREI